MCCHMCAGGWGCEERLLIRLLTGLCADWGGAEAASCECTGTARGGLQARVLVGMEVPEAGGGMDSPQAAQAVRTEALVWMGEQGSAPARSGTQRTPCDFRLRLRRGQWAGVHLRRDVPPHPELSVSCPIWVLHLRSKPASPYSTLSG